MYRYELTYSYVPGWNWCLYKRPDDDYFYGTPIVPPYKGMTLAAAKEMLKQLNQSMKTEER